jgi:hypothetical protein
MANEQNLNHKLTESELRKGGRKSGKARRAKKQFRETCELLLSLDCTMEKAKETMKKMGIPENEQTNQMAITISMLKAALGGNVQAYKELRDTVGEKPINHHDLTSENKQIIIQTNNAIKDLTDKL